MSMSNKRKTLGGCVCRFFTIFSQKGARNHYKMESQVTNKTKKPSKVEEMTKEQIRQAITKKRECNAKAQQIVESLLEIDVTEDYLLQCLPDINQSHFEDIVEERSILHICGYPLCANKLMVKDIPKQKYRISLKTNKVYDISARKSFCSNSCYKAAMFIKQQMLTSPLWFREYEIIPKFVLPVKDAVGSLGQEVDLSLVESLSIQPHAFASINDFTKASLNEMTDNNENENITQNKIIEQKEINTTRNTEDKETDLANIEVQQIKEDCSTNQNNKNELHKSTEIEPKPKISKKTISNSLNIVGEIKERPSQMTPIIIKKPDAEKSKSSSSMNTTQTEKAKVRKQPAITALTIEVEKCLAEWFTLDTLIFIFGEARVKEMVADKGECIKEYLNNYAKSIFYSSNTYDQYQALCRKLNMLEIEDRKFDADMLKRETKPLPDYTMLQEESKRMQLKVNAFLTGNTDIPDVESVEVEPTTDENVTQLPLVDKNAQNALRRRIVYQHLNKVLPDLLRSLGLLTLSISSDVRLMVNTFKLKANNIMFKPVQWTLIAIVIIKLLSLRDRRLDCLLVQPMAYEHMQLLLMSYKQDGGYLDRLLCWLTDVDRLLDTNDTQLTIE